MQMFSPAIIESNDTRTKSWVDVVREATLYEPANVQLYQRITSIEGHIRHDMSVLRKDTLDHLESLSNLYAYKHQILTLIGRTYV